MDQEKIVSNVVTLWFKDRETLKRFFIIIGLIVLFSIITAVIVIGLVLLLAGPASLDTVANPQILEQLGVVGLIFILVLVPLFLFFVLFLGYQFYKINIRALQVVGFETAPFNFVKFLKALIFLSLYTSFAVITSWFHEKWRIYFIAIFILGLFGLLGGFLFSPLLFLSLLALLMFCPYILVMIYNSIRLSMGNSIYLQKNQGVIDSVKESWVLTEGKAVEIFAANVIVGIVIFIIALGLLVVQFGIQFFFLVLNFASIGAIAAGLFSLFYQLVLNVMQQFLNPSIYAQLKNQAPLSPPEKLQSTEVFSAQNILNQKRQDVSNSRRAVVQNRAASSVEQSAKISQSTPVMDGPLTMSESSQVEKLVDLLKDKTHDYSKEDMIHVMQEKGYSTKVVTAVLKKLRKN
ncbi:MAG: hypothetical protein NUV57_01535 [archaeon]|nr:hypothetical protein [archaeon]